MQTDEEKRAVLEEMGEGRVRSALANGMLVWHLVNIAQQWLEEIDSKRAEAASH
ncbi:MAG: hypothetical protein P4L90_26095 [Rhodopila sp.]|nr:hypothetical protein [Rhodopila sp.]